MKQVFTFFLFIPLFVARFGYAELDLGGDLRVRYYNEGLDAQTLVLKRVRLKGVSKLSKRITLCTKLDLAPKYGDNSDSGYQVEVKEGYLAISELPYSLELILGKVRNKNFGLVPSWKTRRTSNHGIASTIFTRPRVLGIQLNAPYKRLRLGFSVLNGHRPIAKSIKEDEKKYLFLVDEPMEVDDNDEKEVTALLGYKILNGLDIAVFTSYERISKGAVRKLEEDLLVPLANRDKSRDGLFLTYSIHPFIFQAEFYQAETAGIGHTAWQALLGYCVAPELSIYARYGEVEHSSEVPALCRIERFTTSFRIKVSEKVDLILECESGEEYLPKEDTKSSHKLIFAEVWAHF